MTTLDEPVDQPVAVRKRPNALIRMYRGDTSFNFVGRRRTWYLISGAIILAGVISLGTRGLNLSIDFRGGQSWTVQTSHLSVAQATALAKKAGVSDPTVLEIGTGSNRTIEVEADLSKLSTTSRQNVEDALSRSLGDATHQEVSLDDVGPTWGGQVTDKAVEALIVFFVLIVAYISIRFEWKMAIAALIAMVHDLLVTVGVYSLTGFQVSPDTVIAILTILGYSLYDTVVVFDRVGENTKGLGASGRMTYEDVVNLSMNQVLARSINTSLVAIIPVLSVLVIGAEILGATTLQDFGLALVIGLTSGAYSSIFIASPVLSSMKERESRYVSIRQKLANRTEREGLLSPRAAAALVGASANAAANRAGGRSGGARSTSRPAGAIRPGSAAGRSTSVDTGPADRDSGEIEDLEVRETSTGPGRQSQGGAPTNRRPPPRPRKGKGKGGKRR
jgi:preprotein translocase subunit SecF